MTNDDSDIYYTQLRDYDYLHDRENHLARTCGYENNIYYGQIVTTNDDIWGSGCFEVMYYFVNQKGSVDLKITNTVNNVLEFIKKDVKN